jgi:hypothetical protein
MDHRFTPTGANAERLSFVRLSLAGHVNDLNRIASRADPILGRASKAGERFESYLVHQPKNETQARFS